MLQDSLKSNPDDAKANDMLGNIYLKSKLVKKAEEAFLKAVKSKDVDASVYRSLASLYEEKGDTDKAIGGLFLSI